MQWYRASFETRDSHPVVPAWKGKVLGKKQQPLYDADYLQLGRLLSVQAPESARRYLVFSDLRALAPFRLPRPALPPSPEPLRGAMGYRYTAGDS